MKRVLEITVESLNKEAFMQAASDAYDTFVAAQEADFEAIGKAVNAIFDRYKGAKINVPALEHYVLSELNATPSTFGLMTERIKAYLSENKGDNRESGKLYGTGKGKGGGIWRWKDQAEKPAA